MGNHYNRKRKRCISQAVEGSTVRSNQGPYTDRPQLAKAIAALAEGDCLVVCKLDRLARSTRDLLNTLDAIGKAGATFRSLADQWADTTTPHGRLMLTVLGGLAEFERHLARKAIKEQLRGQGVKLSYVPAREINAQAKLLAQRPEIIEEAKAKAAALGWLS